METYQFKNDLKIFCVTAKSFPQGIGEAFHTLEQSLPNFAERTFFGISYPDEKGGLIYKAGASSIGEEDTNDLEIFTIKKGTYLTEVLLNWRQNETSIADAFRKLGDAQPETVPPGIEWYTGEDVLCMLRLENQEAD